MLYNSYNYEALDLGGNFATGLLGLFITCSHRGGDRRLGAAVTWREPSTCHWRFHACSLIVDAPLRFLDLKASRGVDDMLPVAIAKGYDCVKRYRVFFPFLTHLKQKTGNFFYARRKSIWKRLLAIFNFLVRWATFSFFLSASLFKLVVIHTNVVALGSFYL